MKKKTLSVILPILLAMALGFLAATNPSEEDFTKYVQQKTARYDEKATAVEQITSLVMGQSARLDSELHVRRENYLVCSVFVYKGAFTGMKEERFLGLANQFIKIHEEH
ncbi:MAG: hypothetical protein JSU94_05610 [Phycisphaerales bacterium]|nr:MAG: hypothetical protein JSU94_05610 [Phycisphaerales bacterium]